MKAALVKVKEGATKRRQKALQDERKVKTTFLNRRRVFTAFFWLLVLAVSSLSFVSFNRTHFLNAKMNTVKADVNDKMTALTQDSFATSPAGQLYSKRFVHTFINIPRGTKEREARKAKLEEMVAENIDVAKMENLEAFSNGRRVLTTCDLYDMRNVKGNQAEFLYTIHYDLYRDEGVQPQPKEGAKPKDEKQSSSKAVTPPKAKEKKIGSREALMTVRIETDGQGFNIIEQPYFAKVPEKTRLQGVKNNLEFKSENRVKAEELQAFAEQFFKSYAENNELEMAYLMEKPEALEGLYEFAGVADFKVYDGKQPEQYTVKTFADFKEAESGVTARQPFTLTVVKQNGKYFVKTLTHTIGE
jgi:hypothetical protein